MTRNNLLITLAHSSLSKGVFIVVVVAAFKANCLLFSWQGLGKKGTVEQERERVKMRDGAHTHTHTNTSWDWARGARGYWLCARRRRRDDTREGFFFFFCTATVDTPLYIYMCIAAQYIYPLKNSSTSVCASAVLCVERLMANTAERVECRVRERERALYRARAEQRNVVAYIASSLSLSHVCWWLSLVFVIVIWGALSRSVRARFWWLWCSGEGGRRRATSPSSISRTSFHRGIALQRDLVYTYIYIIQYVACNPNVLGFDALAFAHLQNFENHILCIK